VKTGPEVIAGSTRMKAALAQKVVLHMISTASMIRLGNVYRNYMVGVRPTNQKLIERAHTIIRAVTGVDQDAAAQALRRSGRNVKLAILMLSTGVDRVRAQHLLERCGGNLRAIL
jgi:N-acetylmuramic acid 6-phosphate etherase